MVLYSQYGVLLLFPKNAKKTQRTHISVLLPSKYRARDWGAEKRAYGDTQRDHTEKRLYFLRDSFDTTYSLDYFEYRTILFK